MLTMTVMVVVAGESAHHVADDEVQPVRVGVGVPALRCAAARPFQKFRVRGVCRDVGEWREKNQSVKKRVKK